LYIIFEVSKDEWLAQLKAEDIPRLVYLDLEEQFYRSFETYKLPAGAEEVGGLAKFMPYLIFGGVIFNFLFLIFLIKS